MSETAKFSKAPKIWITFLKNFLEIILYKYRLYINTSSKKIHVQFIFEIFDFFLGNNLLKLKTDFSLHSDHRKIIWIKHLRWCKTTRGICSVLSILLFLYKLSRNSLFIAAWKWWNFNLKIVCCFYKHK